MKFNEGDLRVWLRKVWKGYIDWREPRSNIGLGAPDCQLFVSSRIVPVELKVGVVTAASVKMVIRPSQYAWHKRASDLGIATAFLIGVDRSRVYICASNIVIEGFGVVDMDRLLPVWDDASIKRSLRSLL